MDVYISAEKFSELSDKTVYSKSGPLVSTLQSPARKLYSHLTCDSEHMALQSQTNISYLNIVYLFHKSLKH